ncbi:helix-turn-helix transcriptional regulator [Paenarthrobacter sp. JL.01a]|uniref:helix-turn-helix transcriptional regulator n=1 Tax=Paenarthrobacter sp. JL.01a TaxID=2979324 RepID=UPI0021C91873|nr:helix-turn-helix domain-containing protein [Paenarthrobacter sp. JL.01a]UXM90362.1 transcriptional regulator [Paenarthrobacter sp. JL.01a]
MSASGLPWTRRIAAVASLGDDHRRRLFEYVLAAPEPVGRDEAAAAMDLPRSTASFHLERLAREGILRVEFRKAAHKAGPGSGRPAKLYSPEVQEVSASIPERNYDLAGHLMAGAISRSTAEGIPVGAALIDVARGKGRESGKPGDLPGALRDLGYEPSADGLGGYRLRNCPFHRLSQDHEDVVCTMNGAFLSGVASASGLSEDCVILDPGAGHCCARIGTVQEITES